MKGLYGAVLACLTLVGAGVFPVAAEGQALPISAWANVQNETPDVASWLPDGTMHPFLEKKMTNRKWHYQSMDNLSVVPKCAGLLTVPGKKADTAMLALGVEMKGPAADTNFQGMFMPGGYTPEAGKKMLAFNMGLMSSENVLNELFLKTTSSTGQMTGQAIPFDLLAVDMVTVEQLHKVKTMEDTYTFAMRPLVVADGWLLPLYVRGVAAKREGAYQFLLLTGWDNSRAVIDKTAEKLMKSSK